MALAAALTAIAARPRLCVTFLPLRLHSTSSMSAMATSVCSAPLSKGTASMRLLVKAIATMAFLSGFMAL